MKLSRLAGTIVFILVLVPSLIAALDALQIDAVSRPATMMLGQMLDAVPHIIAAAVILLVTWYVARFVAACWRNCSRAPVSTPCRAESAWARR